MKSTEVQTLWKLVKAGENRHISAADFRLLLRVRAALMDYEREITFEPHDAERRCMICGVPVNQCCC